MRARVRRSSGLMWTNCEEVQQAVHVPHGTSASCSALQAACRSLSHDENGPAARGRPSASGPSSGILTFGTDEVCPIRPGDRRRIGNQYVTVALLLPNPRSERL
jgi:hypothetical protein